MTDANVPESAPPIAPSSPPNLPVPPIPEHRPSPRPRERQRRSLGALALTIGIVVAGTFGAWLGRETAPSGSPSTANSAAPLEIPSLTPDPSGSDRDNPSSDGDSTSPTPNSTGTIDADAITAEVNPSIVNITTTAGGGQGAGTGMIITSSGDVLTNNHVINGATSISVELSNGTVRSAKVVGYDADDDIAVIKIQGASNLPTISTASAATVRVGDPVLAVGNALGRGGTPTPAAGTVTALNRTITASNRDGSDAATLTGLIETDAPIQPGDSGGPLFNADAKVIGVNAAASVSRGFGFSGTTASEGYAITIDKALSIVEQIENGDESDGVHVGERGILGVSIQGDALGSTGDGAVVADVQSGSPAAGAGIVAGDRIVAVGNDSVGSSTQLKRAMYPYHPGDRVSVAWVDGSGQRHTATVTLIAVAPA